MADGKNFRCDFAACETGLSSVEKRVVQKEEGGVLLAKESASMRFLVGGSLCQRRPEIRLSGACMRYGVW